MGGFGTAIVPGIALAGDGTMNKVGGVGDRLQCDLGAIEGAATGCGAGLQGLGTALFALLGGFVLVRGTARFVEDFLHLIDQHLNPPSGSGAQGGNYKCPKGARLMPQSIECVSQGSARRPP